ncbi:1-acyl-sn-glycerol-3-phosphate acyltransferase alpha [Ischnura elegans]|uniref:1-acyl-sn-glycerol-3-phosphate acyltransferase alpha n=1 Tax=Ischnura elegans TaxID=197161 RepID=UPI001ED86EA3|nr:1-acyl-sn-glycerol-3-phosphate acyltransferase alpha [Ischnura elegans]
MLKEIASVISVLIVLYYVSSTFRYVAKFFIFGLLSVISASIFIPLMLRKPRDPKNANLPAWGSRMTAKLLGVKYKIRGKENICHDEGCVVLMNHQSAIDLFVLANLWKIMERCTVIVKKAVFFIWPFGLGAWLWGTIYIDRQNKESARSAVNKTSIAIKERKAKILMFPEGTRHNGETLLPFKKGAFHVALGAEAPILPVVTSRYYFIDHKNRRFDEGDVILTILPPIPTKGKTTAELDALIEDTRNRMVEVHRKTTEEVLAYARPIK